MKLWLVRHGETEWNASHRYQGFSDIPLNERGLMQAKSAGALLTTEPLAAVYSSDLRRAAQTAAVIAASHQLPVETCTAFRELNFGVWEGLTYAQIMQQWPEELQLMYNFPAHGRAPAGEGFYDVAARAWRRLAALAVTHADDAAIAVVAHDGVLRTLLCRLEQRPLEELWTFSIGQAVPFVVDFPSGLQG